MKTRILIPVVSRCNPCGDYQLLTPSSFKLFFVFFRLRPEVNLCRCPTIFGDLALTHEEPRPAAPDYIAVRAAGRCLYAT